MNNANWAVAWEGQDAPAAWGSPAAPSTPLPNLIPHGTWWDLKKDDPPDQVMAGRFTRLFPDLPGARFNQHELELLAEAMTVPAEESGSEAEAEENRTIPAAYTYLGQFADHDITFDPISHLRETLSPAQLNALVDFPDASFRPGQPVRTRGPDKHGPTCMTQTGSTCSQARLCSATPSTPARSSYPGGRAAGRSSATPGPEREPHGPLNCTPSSCGFTNKVADPAGKGASGAPAPAVRDSGPMALPVDPGQRLPACNRQ